MQTCTRTVRRAACSLLQKQVGEAAAQEAEASARYNEAVQQLQAELNRSANLEVRRADLAAAALAW